MSDHPTAVPPGASAAVVPHLVWAGAADELAAAMQGGSA